MRTGPFTRSGPASPTGTFTVPMKYSMLARYRSAWATHRSSASASRLSGRACRSNCHRRSIASGVIPVPPGTRGGAGDPSAAGRLGLSDRSMSSRVRSAITARSKSLA